MKQVLVKASDGLFVEGGLVACRVRVGDGFTVPKAGSGVRRVEVESPVILAGGEVRWLVTLDLGLVQQGLFLTGYTETATGMMLYLGNTNDEAVDVWSGVNLVVFEAVEPVLVTEVKGRFANGLAVLDEPRKAPKPKKPKKA